MKIWRVNIVVFMTVLMMGCHGKKDTLYDIPLYRSLKSAVEFTPGDYIDSIRYIPLETTDSCFMGDVYKIIRWKDFYYIRDLNEHLFFFFSYGKFVCSIGRKGRGANEYVALADFTIDPENGDIYLVVPGKIMVYAYTGELLRTMEVDSDWQVAALDRNGHLIFIIPVSRDQKEPLLIVCDKGGQVIREIKGMEVKCDIAYFNWLHEQDGRVYYKEEFSDTLCYLDGTLNSHPYALVDFGDYKFQPSHFSMGMINQWPDCYRLGGVFDFDHSMVLNVQRGLMDQVENLNTYLFDKKKGKVGVFEKNTDSNGFRIGGVVYAPRAAWKNQLICIIASSSVIGNAKISDPELEKLVSQMDENANPVLAVFDMK